MKRKSSRNNVQPTSSKPSRPAKCQRKPTQPFDQGVNPAPPTLPSTVWRPVRLPEPTLPHNQGTPSPPEALFVAEDEDVVEESAADAGLDDDNEVDEQVENALAAATAVGEVTAGSPGSATAASLAQSSQPQRPESEQIDEEPHLHWNYCAWWTLGKNSIPQAAVARRNKPLYTVDEDRVWQWADGVVEKQLPRVAIIDSLTATLYYTSGRQAKSDRCTIALQRRQSAAGWTVVAGNWFEFEEELAEMDKESGQIMTCDFDLVLREQQAPQPATQPASQPAQSTARSRPGIVTAIMEEGLASVVTNERFASGHAIGIRDHWRCQSERCSNNPGVCWVRLLPGRQVERASDHYPLNSNMIANWASAITRQECTVEEPSQDLQLQFIMSKDRSARENKRRRKSSPASSSSSLENLTKAILVGHLAQLKQPQQQCQHQSEPSQRQRWVDIKASRVEMVQHTRNFFNYWKLSMPHVGEKIRTIYTMCKEEQYDINMLMDPVDGMTFEMWTFYEMPPSMLSHLQRKAHDWMKDYTGLSEKDVQHS
ncbi:hypothetical protein BU25DRAFT_329187 [Macroventuria anomochaeta]|uniref:Uncharacterized protein n=1 Tax=Macroventuria anomochaeta TaxID=301207 RepID=A0ACB6SHH2_9PLEO|nr:uncharacterized protein BU25DRAFT_329187 [Macroventuria anomochaeta]KAF2633484.1 hypothetical protein BU25DRAFT_329187 [Macroventuria anomochaeta]